MISNLLFDFVLRLTRAFFLMIMFSSMVSSVNAVPPSKLRNESQSQFETDIDHIEETRSARSVDSLVSSLMSQIQENKKNVESAISTISSADSIIIATNLGRCSDKKRGNSSKRCLIDLNSIKCLKRSVPCDYLSWIYGMYPQTTIKIFRKADKSSLEQFIQTHIAIEANEVGIGAYGCNSIDGTIIIYSKSRSFDLQYDRMNRSLSGVKMDGEFWRDLLGRYNTKSDERLGC